MDVIFDLGAPHARLPAFVVGTMTRPLPLRESGTVHLEGVRFRPGGLTAFLDVRAVELVDGRARLDEVGGTGEEEAWERLHGGEEGFFDTLLPRWLERRRRRDRPSVRRASLLLREAQGVETVAREVGTSRRQLERRFLEAVGVGPATLRRVLRFRHAVELLGLRPAWSLSRVAHEAGYHDQPHFNRDFRTLAGETPGEHRRRTRGVPPSDDVASVQDAERSED